MNLYTDAIHRSPLFKRFDTLAGFDSITQAEIDQLKGLILNIAEQVGPQMSQVALTFKQYTDHSIIHLTNIANLIDKFLPKTDRKKSIGLNALELTLLWTGILLHDIGMFVSESEKAAVLQSPAFTKFKLRSKDRIAAADKARSQGNEPRARAIEDAMTAEYFRRIHATRSAHYIRNHFPTKLIFRNVDYVEEAAQLAESHNWRVFRTDGGLSTEPSVSDLPKDHLIDEVPVNLQYLACCLRMGDILDFDRSRTPLVVFEHMDFTESISEQEWHKHLSIKGWSITSKKVRFTAKCKKPEYYVAVQDFLGWVDQELDNFHRIVETFKDQEEQRYPILLPHKVSRDHITMAAPNHISGAFKYQLEFEEIMKLLMDRSLYPDPALFLRELLQNSLDACRYQVALATKAGMADKYIPRIDVWDHSTHPTDPHIIFQDNGIGMSLDIINNYFLRVGKSFYRSPEFTTERELLAEQGIFLDSCSRFGIGFLSCFLAGDNIEVETYRQGHRPLKIHISGPSRYFLIEQLPTSSNIPFLSPLYRLEDGPPHHPGTRIILHLKPNWRQYIKISAQGFVADTLELYAAAPDFEILVHGTDLTPIVLNNKPFYTPPSIIPYINAVPNIWTPYLQKHLSMAPIPLPKGDTNLLFEGNLWAVMFKDKQGSYSSRSGWLQLCDASDHLEDFTERKMGIDLNQKCLRILHILLENLGEEKYKALSRKLQAIEDFDEFEFIKENDSLSFIHYLDSVLTTASYGDWIELSIDERKLVLKGIKRFAQYSPQEENSYAHSSQLQEAIQNMDITSFIDVFDGHPMDVFPKFELNFDQNHKLALHGILLSTGILDWNPQKGNAQKQDFLPVGVYLNLNLRGVKTPEPSANRLFIAPEKAQNFIQEIGIAILDWAYKVNKDTPHRFNYYIDYYIRNQVDVVLALLPLLQNHIYIKVLENNSIEHLFTLTHLLQKYGYHIPIKKPIWSFGNDKHLYDHPIFHSAPLITNPDGPQYRDLTEWLPRYLPDFKFDT